MVDGDGTFFFHPWNLMKMIPSPASLFVNLIAFMLLAKGDYPIIFLNNTLEDLFPGREKYFGKDVADDAIVSNISSCEELEHDEGLKISCQELDFTKISQIIPPETIHLEISNSFYPILNLPYFSQLSNLRTLKLTNNSHKFITSKAFMGLENLKSLNLSVNYIVVLSKAFAFTSGLEDLDLSNNYISNVGIVAKAASSAKQLRNLTLNHNYRIRRILKDDFLPLQNSSLEIIKLFNTTLAVIEEGAFGVLRQLRVLDLSVNYLGEEALHNVTKHLKNTSIDYLATRVLLGLKGFPYEALAKLQNTTIRHLDVGHNYFPKLPKFPEIHSLLDLRMSHCSITELDNGIFVGLPNLEDLELDGNSIFSINEAIFSLIRLKRLSMLNQGESFETKPRIILNSFAFSNMSHLSYLNFRRTTVNDRITRYVLNGLKSLEILILMSAGIEEIDDYAFETLFNLLQLNLQGNKLTRLTNYTFYGLKRLRILVLAQNKITFFQNDYPFENNNYIYLLHMHENEIQNIPPGVFASLSHLKTLSLFSNSLTAWNETVLSVMSNLTELHLAKNMITRVTPAMMNDFSQITDALDLTQNPFNCSDCDMKAFQNFLRTTDLTLFLPVLLTSEYSYRCSFPKSQKGKSLLEVTISQSHCVVRPSTQTSVMIAVVVSSLILFLLSLTIPCYFFRWYVRYWVFHIRTSIRERRGSNGVSQHYVYDAFVCYNVSDTPWVVNHMIPALEGQEPRLRLCIHERDFEVGRLITDNILDAIESSRTVILLLTDSFAKSEWCMFELHLAQHKLFDDSRDALLIIKLKNIDNKLYSKDLRYLERTRTCFTWTDNPVGQKLFWNKIRKFFGKDICFKLEETGI